MRMTAITLALSLAATSVVAQPAPPGTPPAPGIVVAGGPPGIIIAGGVGTGGIVLGLLGLLLLAGLGGSSCTTTPAPGC